MKWDKREIAAEQVKSIAAKYGCDILTASILLRRGITEAQDICFFLESDTRHLRNPFELPGMEDAVDRILAAKEEEEKVLIFGDRDVDGITSTTLLADYLSELGIDLSWRLPVGDDPYGLSIHAVEEFAAAYGTLIITVDCGISNVEEIRRANELGVDVIVTDHHNPPEELPEALSIINPKLASSTYPFRDLSGCSVAYKLVSALRFAAKSSLYGQPVCLLNTRPVHEAWVVEAVKLRNMAVSAQVSETVIPGGISITATRLPAFLEGQQILCWDAPLQRKTLAKLFGSGVEIYMQDVSEEIGREIPQAAGKSLLRIKELSRIARYADRELTELDVFVNLFTSFVYKREKLAPENDAMDLQLAALSTIADIVPLRDENRIIARAGLASLMEKPRPGISDLLFKLGMAGRRFDSKDVSWNLCPTLNAAGRMGSADKAAALLMEKDGAKRDRLADEIIAFNQERKSLEGEIWPLAEERARNSLEAYGGKLVLAAGEEIKRGVTGNMANKLAKLFHVPAIVVSFQGETAVGSLRSEKNFKTGTLLKNCKDLFIDWGGHDHASGFSMMMSNWEAFTERLKGEAMNIETVSMEEASLSIDAELPQSYLNPDIFKVVDRFEPYGEENEALVFLAKKLKIDDVNIVGKTGNRHAKLSLNSGIHKWPALYWGAADKINVDFALNDTVDVVFNFSRNWFNGMETLQMEIIELKRSSE
ncbi:MAG: single-stranded-DNA-specific exonuclease RecJ [Treponema sp.]|jgi:single-stranded-DNA-specific exonuclease|nr:single-stranded-DNA-specific exonuclease RecJ [Treponema sp.]